MASNVTAVKPYKKGDRLTLKQRRWIDEYLKCNNYTIASRNAGYSGNDNNLRTIGYQNSIKFKELLVERANEVNRQGIASLDDIFKFWTDVYKDEDTKTADRIKASELLAKAKGGFIEKVEVKKVNTDWFIDDKE